jgi:ATP-dependent protease ClpP protease subunit
MISAYFYISGEIDAKMFKEFGDWYSSEFNEQRFVVVNSFGGSISYATAIADMIMEGGINTIAAGVVYSAALVVFLAGLHRKMYSMCMIYDHEPYSGDLNGGANEVRKGLVLVDSWSKSMRDLYAERTNLPETDIDMMFSRDGWVCGARKAKSLGLCHEILGVYSCS